jgi:plastocyanin
MDSTKTSIERSWIIAAMIICLAIGIHLSALPVKEVAAQTTHEVKIVDFAFVPQSIAVSPGDSILWNNTDPVIHTLWFVLVSNGSTYLLSDPIIPNTTWIYTFNEAVSLQYYSFDKLWITGFINVMSEVRDVAVTNVVTSKTGCLPMETVGEGSIVDINATVENQGDLTETFNVTAYANTTLIDRQEIVLISGDFTVVTFVWDTTGFVKGNYTIRVIAESVPGEADLSDNAFEDGTVLVTVQGDVNGDRVCDMADISILIDAFLAEPGDPHWNPNADLNNDKVIDMADISIAIDHFLQEW